MFAASDEYAEARFVVSEIESLIDGGTSARDISVFYRTNAQSRALEDVLVREGIPYQVVWRGAVLRAGGDKGRHGLPVGDRQPRRLGVPGTHNQRPQEGPRQSLCGEAQDYASKNGISLYDALSEADAASLTGAARKSCRAVRDLFEGLEGGRRGGAADGSDRGRPR